MKDLKDLHELHGLLMGACIYLISGNIKYGVVTGGTLYLFMSKYGHSLP